MKRPYILVADDEEMWRDLITHWLTAEDYCEVKAVSRGKDVLPAAAARRPDLIILDHHLGDTTGMAVCACLKADRHLRKIPVIVLTTMAGEMLNIVKGGHPDHFIAKAEKPDELIQVVEHLLKGK
jgi:CheY-like chemotaxis protein